MLIIAVLTGVALVGVACLAGLATREPTLQPVRAPARNNRRR